MLAVLINKKLTLATSASLDPLSLSRCSCRILFSLPAALNLSLGGKLTLDCLALLKVSLMLPHDWLDSDTSVSAASFSWSRYRLGEDTFLTAWVVVVVIVCGEVLKSK